jgi:replicative DNA helicase
LARHLPEPSKPHSWPDHWLVLLGHLVGDGSYLVHQPLRYTTASEENSSAVRAAAEACGCKVSRHEGIGAGTSSSSVATAAGARRCRKWLKELGIFSQRSHEKHLPPAVFTLR